MPILEVTAIAVWVIGTIIVAALMANWSFSDAAEDWLFIGFGCLGFLVLAGILTFLGNWILDQADLDWPTVWVLSRTIPILAVLISLIVATLLSEHGRIRSRVLASLAILTSGLTILLVVESTQASIFWHAYVDEASIERLLQSAEVNGIDVQPRYERRERQYEIEAYLESWPNGPQKDRARLLQEELRWLDVLAEAESRTETRAAATIAAPLVQELAATDHGLSPKTETRPNRIDQANRKYKPPLIEQRIQSNR